MTLNSCSLVSTAGVYGVKGWAQSSLHAKENALSTEPHLHPPNTAFCQKALH